MSTSDRDPNCCLRHTLGGKSTEDMLCSNDDAEYDRLDPGVRKLVRLLRGHSFNTTDSGDGKTKLAGIPEADWPDEILDIPHVVMVVERSQFLLTEARRLLQVMTFYGIDVIEGMIQASYDPVNHEAIIVLTSVTDDMLK